MLKYFWKKKFLTCSLSVCKGEKGGLLMNQSFPLHQSTNDNIYISVPVTILYLSSLLPYNTYLMLGHTDIYFRQWRSLYIQLFPQPSIAVRRNGVKVITKISIIWEIYFYLIVSQGLSVLLQRLFHGPGIIFCLTEFKNMLNVLFNVHKIKISCLSNSKNIFTMHVRYKITFAIKINLIILPAISF